jgi:hypothetical protein
MHRRSGRRGPHKPLRGHQPNGKDAGQDDDGGYEGAVDDFLQRAVIMAKGDGWWKGTIAAPGKGGWFSA